MIVRSVYAFSIVVDIYAIDVLFSPVTMLLSP